MHLREPKWKKTEKTKSKGKRKGTGVTHDPRKGRGDTRDEVVSRRMLKIVRYFCSGLKDEDKRANDMGPQWK